MKTTIFVTAATIIAAAAFTSCDKGEAGRDADNNAVRFAAAIGETASPQSAAATRASGTTWTAGDAIGIFMVESGTNAIAENASNRQYTTTDAGILTAAGSEIYYPMDGSTVDFIAYYPWADGSALTAALPVVIGDQTEQPSFDLLWAKADNSGAGYGKSSAAVPLVFAHKLSKLILTTAAGTGVAPADLAGMTVVIKGMNTTASFDLAAGALSGPATVADITPLTVADAEEYEAIVLPADIAAGALTVEFTINPSTAPETFVWQVPATAFESGTEHTWEITLSRTGVTGIQGSITPWIDSPDGTGTAE